MYIIYIYVHIHIYAHICTYIYIKPSFSNEFPLAGHASSLLRLQVLRLGGVMGGGSMSWRSDLTRIREDPGSGRYYHPQLIGLKENYRKIPSLKGESMMVSCRFSLKSTKIDGFRLRCSLSRQPIDLRFLHSQFTMENGPEEFWLVGKTLPL